MLFQGSDTAPQPVPTELELEEVEGPDGVLIPWLHQFNIYRALTAGTASGYGSSIPQIASRRNVGLVQHGTDSSCCLAVLQVTQYLL